jgi:hypothetical protein
VAYLRQKRRVNFRSNKFGAGNLKRKYLNRIYSALAVKVLRLVFNLLSVPMLNMKFLAVVQNQIDKSTHAPCNGCLGIILIEDTAELLKV